MKINVAPSAANHSYMCRCVRSRDVYHALFERAVWYFITRYYVYIYVYTHYNMHVQTYYVYYAILWRARKARKKNDRLLINRKNVSACTIFWPNWSVSNIFFFTWLLHVPLQLTCRVMHLYIMRVVAEYSITELWLFWPSTFWRLPGRVSRTTFC